MKNPIAKDVRTAKYKMRIIKSKKGKGSYNRKGRVKTLPDRLKFSLKRSQKECQKDFLLLT